MWFLLSLLKPFIDIITQTYIETLRENTENTLEIEKFAWEDKEISTYKGLSTNNEYKKTMSIVLQKNV